MTSSTKLRLMVLEKHGGSYTNINGSTYWIPPDGSRPYHVNLVFLRRMASREATKKEQVQDAKPIQVLEPAGKSATPEPTKEPEPIGSEEGKEIVEKTEEKVEHKESKKKEKSSKKKTIKQVEAPKEQGQENKVEEIKKEE